MENLDEMKDRIAHIIRAKNLTAAEFALRLGIQPSNISHLLAGRNNPSLEFVKKLKETFPEYCLDWIIFGRGPMTESTVFASAVSPAPSAETGNDTPEKVSFEEKELPLNLDVEEVKLEQASQRLTTTPKQIILVFDDHTFEVLLPR